MWSQDMNFLAPDLNRQLQPGMLELEPRVVDF